jgi:hypothetical protein
MRRCNDLGPLRLSTALAVGLLALCPCAPGDAAVLATLYEATVTADAADPQRAAEEALREVATRVTGRRGAGSDVALAGLYEGARQYVQTMRPAGTGQVTVVFDAPAVDAALLHVGQPLWSRERPATLVVLLLDRPSAGRALLTDETETEDKRSMERMAQWRGVPLVWPAASAELAAHAAEAQEGRLEPLLEWARRSEADAVLVGRPAGGQIAWTAAGPAAAGPLSGAPADVVQALADRYAANFATAAGAALLPTEVLVSGIGDFKAYGATLAYLAGLTNVRGVRVVEVAGDTVRFLVSYRGDAGALQRTVTLGGKLLPDSTGGDGTLRFHRPP